jgi:hypothetical protein
MIKLVDLVLTPDQRKALAGRLTTAFENAVSARRNQIDAKYKRWNDNYLAKPAEKIRTTPFYKASNFVPQLIRMHTDILIARLLGIVVGTKPFWIPKTFIAGVPHQWMEQLGTWLEHKSQFELKLFEVIDETITRAVKSGTVINKAFWLEDVISVAYATNMGTVMKDLAKSSLKVVAMPYDDFFVTPITATSIDDVEICFHRLRLTKDQVEWRKAKGLWSAEAAELLLTGNKETESGPARQSQAEHQGLILTQDVDRPFTAVEAHLDYTIGAKKHRIIVTFNPFIRGEKSILRAYHNPSSRALKQIIDFRIFPIENSFYGSCVPEILEQAQEEQAQIHNQRRDSRTIMNSPGWKKKKYADVGNPNEEWWPGKVFELENMDDLDVLQFQIQYDSMIEEEQFLLSLAERYTGIGAPMQAAGQGILDGKRGIYNSQGTFAMLAEGNRRLDLYVKRFRSSFHNLGNLIFTNYKDHRPEGDEYVTWGENGQAIKQIFNFNEPEGFEGLYFEIGASDASANKEIERSNLLLMANTMSGYYRQVVESASLVTQIPPDHPLREIMLMVLDGARDLANRLLFQFDLGDRKSLVPDVRAVLGGGVPAADAAAEARGLPEPDGALSNEGLADLSARLSALPRGAGLPT